MDSWPISNWSRRAFLGAIALGGAAGLSRGFVSDAEAVEPSETIQFLQDAYEKPLVVTREEAFTQRKKVLVVVDYQVDFVDGGVFGRIEPALAIEDALYDRIAEYHQRDDIVIYTMDTHPADRYDYTREATVNPLHCVPGSDGWQVYGKVRELLTPETAIMLMKGTYGCMDLPRVIETIRGQGVYLDSIELAGVSTTCRVLHNAILLYNAFPEVPLVMDVATTASYTDELTREQLEELESWGFAVRW